MTSQPLCNQDREAGLFPPFRTFWAGATPAGIFRVVTSGSIWRRSACRRRLSVGEAVTSRDATDRLLSRALTSLQRGQCLRNHMN